MSQGSLILPTTGTVSGLSLAQSINAALANLASNASGATDPSTLAGGVQPFSYWADTSVTPNMLRQRNSANTDWITIGDLTQTGLGLAKNGANSDITSLTGLTSINGGPISGVRNLLINGFMMIDQRNSGAAQTFTAGAAVAYCVDRFYASCTGANITGRQVSATAGGYRFTGAASNTGTLFGQRIESYNIANLANSTVTHQIRISSSSITSVTWTAYYANAQDTFGTKTAIATGTFTISSTATAYSAPFNAGASAANGIAIEYTTGALLAGQTLNYAAAQFEPGVTATAVGRLPYSDDLMLSQRYFLNAGIVYVPALVSGVSCGNLTFPATMRGSPTLTCSAPGFTVSVLSTVAANFYSTTTGGYALTVNSEL
jgi:hypothetical protein